MGHRVLAAEMHAQQNEPSGHDGRHYGRDRTPYLPHALPTEVQVRGIKLLQVFGLFCDALDLIGTADGTYVFLERHPFGQ